MTEGACFSIAAYAGEPRSQAGAILTACDRGARARGGRRALDGWPCSLPTSALGLSPLRGRGSRRKGHPRHSGPWVSAASARRLLPSARRLAAAGPGVAGRPLGLLGAEEGPGGAGGLAHTSWWFAFLGFQQAPRPSLPGSHSSCFVCHSSPQEARAHGGTDRGRGWRGRTGARRTGGCAPSLLSAGPAPPLRPG